VKKKILVIDDEQEIVDLVEMRLTNEGYEVFGVSDGVDGLKKIKEVQPDLIILDVMMPRMDGYTFMRKMNQDENMPKPPVLILTARNDFRLLMEIEGVRDYLEKPYDADVLLSKIRQVLNG